MKKSVIFSLLAVSYPAAALYAQESEAIRKEKTVMIETHAGFNGSGAGFGIFLPDDSRLDFAKSQRDFMQYDAYRIYKLEYQSFIGNSFYYSLGLSHRTMKNEAYYYGPNYAYSEYLSSVIESVHGHLVIGNEWSFRYFFIGAEWAGFSTPLAWKVTTYYPDHASEAERNMWDRVARRDAVQTVMILPNLYIGFAF